MNKRQQKKQMKKRFESFESVTNFIGKTINNVINKIKEDPQFVLNELMESDIKGEVRYQLIALCLFELDKRGK